MGCGSSGSSGVVEQHDVYDDIPTVRVDRHNANNVEEGHIVCYKCGLQLELAGNAYTNHREVCDASTNGRPMPNKRCCLGGPRPKFEISKGDYRVMDEPTVDSSEEEIFEYNKTAYLCAEEWAVKCYCGKKFIEVDFRAHQEECEKFLERHPPSPNAPAKPKASAKPQAASPKTEAQPTPPTGKTMTVSSLKALRDKCVDEDGGINKAEINAIVKESTAIVDLFATLEELQDVKETEMKEERGERLTLALELLCLLGCETKEHDQCQKPEYAPKLIRFSSATSLLYGKRMAAILYLPFSNGNSDTIPEQHRSTIGAQLLEIVDSYSKASMALARAEGNPMTTQGENGHPPAEAVARHFCTVFSITRNAQWMWDMVASAVSYSGSASVPILVANGFLKPAIRMMAHDDADVASAGAQFLVSILGDDEVSFGDTEPEIYLQAVAKALERKEGELESSQRAGLALYGLQKLVERAVTSVEVDTNAVSQLVGCGDVMLAMMKLVRRCSDIIYSDKDTTGRALRSILFTAVIMERIIFAGCLHSAQVAGKITHCWDNVTLKLVDADKVFQYFFLTALPKYEEDPDALTKKALKNAALCICGMTLGEYPEPADVLGPVIHFLQQHLDGARDGWAWNGLQGKAEVVQEWVGGGGKLGKRPTCSVADPDWMDRDEGGQIRKEKFEPRFVGISEDVGMIREEDVPRLKSIFD